MKIVFALDHIFLTKGKMVYSHTFFYEILKRYITIFSEVTIVSRERKVDTIQGIPLASGEGVNFVFLQSISSFYSYFGLRQHHEKKMQGILKEHDALIVKLPSEFGMLAAKIAREQKKRYLAEVVGCAWDAMWNYGSMKAKLYAPYFFYSMKQCVREADAVSYVTTRFLQQRYPVSKNAKTLGVSDVLLPKSSKTILDERLTKIEIMEDKKCIFATIANLDMHYKGIDIALQALSQLSKEDVDFEYHVVGDGDPSRYKILAKKLGIENKVCFMGTLSSRDTLFKWLDKVDIYLQPSFLEGLPRAMIEAMSRGCPVIGSSVGGIPELLGKDMLFATKHPEKLLEIILTLVNNKALMGDQAKRNFIEVQKYQQSLLNQKRNNFWIEFRDG